MSLDRSTVAWMEAVPTDETRDAGGAQKFLRVKGYAILWNSPSERMGCVVETIDPKALDSLGDLNKLDVRMQGEHKNLALARTTNDTLRLTKDSHGLLIEADLDPRRSDARDLYYAIERGEVTQMSFGFRIAPDGEVLSESANNTLLAHVTKIEKLYEVSAVNFPAYADTSLEVVDPTDAEDLDEESSEDAMEPADDAARSNPDSLSAFRARSAAERA